MTLFVADIASYQSGLVPAHLRPDCAALIVKCTQGSGYVDPFYAAWLDEARTAGLLVGAYHYVDGSSPAAQAANLKAHIIDPTLIVMLDEEAVGLQQTLEVADAMDAAGLHVKLMYLARSYWSALGSPDLSKPLTARGIALVNAAYPSAAAARPAQLYPGDNAAAWAPYGGVAPTLYQFTEAATEAGQRIDVSAFRGTAAQLTDLFTTAPASAPAATTHQLEEDDMSTQAEAGFATVTWSTGTKHVAQVAYDSIGGNFPDLRVVLLLESGPLVLAESWKPTPADRVLKFVEHQAAAYGIELQPVGAPARYAVTVS